MTDALFTADRKLEPIWWDDAPRPALEPPDLPPTVDVAVVGSGYTGLVAALTLARDGRSVVVFDAEDAGWGCSSRNGGQCGAGFKPDLGELTRHYGRDRAVAIYREGGDVLEHLADFVADENIDCHFSRPGRFVGAHRPGHYETMARGFDELRKTLGTDCHMVPKAEQHTEIGSDIYYGGGVIANHASLHPGLYHNGLLDRAMAAGALIAPHTPVTRIERAGVGFAVAHSRGTLAARDVVVATNGYSNAGRALPAFRRRVIPIGSYMIATEPLEPGLMDQLIPKNRVLNDTRRVVLYYRSSPDRRRIVFGGRVALAETDPLTSGPRLHAIMSEIFPQAAGAKISHSWMGFVAYTFDHMPHMGVHDGLHYAMGYCGSGVALATWLGRKVALRLMGSSEGRTSFDDLPFRSRPFYDGKPWFLASAVAWYKLCDRFGR